MHSASEPDLSKWLATNPMIIGWFRSSVTYVPEANKLQGKSIAMFLNRVRVHALRNDIASGRQEGRSVLEYFAKSFKSKIYFL